MEDVKTQPLTEQVGLAMLLSKPEELANLSFVISTTDVRKPAPSFLNHCLWWFLQNYNRKSKRDVQTLHAIIDAANDRVKGGLCFRFCQLGIWEGIEHSYLYFQQQNKVFGGIFDSLSLLAKNGDSSNFRRLYNLWHRTQGCALEVCPSTCGFLERGQGNRKATLREIATIVAGRSSRGPERIVTFLAHQGVTVPTCVTARSDVVLSGTRADATNNEEVEAMLKLLVCRAK